jgi:hypothetical protein
MEATYRLKAESDLRGYGFIFLADYGGGTWTNGRIHFFNGTLCDIGKPTIKDFTTMRKMELQGVIKSEENENENMRICTR